MRSHVPALRTSKIALVLTLCAVPVLAPACPRTPDELKQKFDQAFRAKDKAALLALFNWEGVDTELRSMQEREYSGLLSHELVRSELRGAAVAEADMKAMTAKGVSLNVKPVASLYVERSVGNKASPGEGTGGHLAVGKVANCHLIGAFAKKKS